MYQSSCRPRSLKSLDPNQDPTHPGHDNIRRPTHPRWGYPPVPFSRPSIRDAGIHPFKVMPRRISSSANEGRPADLGVYEPMRRTNRTANASRPGLRRRRRPPAAACRSSQRLPPRTAEPRQPLRSGRSAHHGQLHGHSRTCRPARARTSATSASLSGSASTASYVPRPCATRCSRERAPARNCFGGLRRPWVSAPSVCSSSRGRRSRRTWRRWTPRPRSGCAASRCSAADPGGDGHRRPAVGGATSVRRAGTTRLRACEFHARGLRDTYPMELPGL